MRLPWLSPSVPLLLAFSTLGCQSPYHADQDAAIGGLFGAGAGAIVGNACGNPLAGAAIGAGAGALAGAAIGSEQDAQDARNRALIAQQMGRDLRAGAVTIEDVVAMTRARVNEDLIVTQVHTHGIPYALRSCDLIYLQQQGVSPRVIAAMQAYPLPPTQMVYVEESPPPAVMVETYPGYWRPGPAPWHHHRPGPW